LLTVHINEALQIRAVAGDGATGLFPRTRIYDGGGSVIATLNLTGVAEGVYGASWTPAVEGFYTAITQFFTDSGHTTDAGYLRAAEDIEVSTEKANISRILGLSQSNVVIDTQVYVGTNLVSARIRTYDTKAHALAAGVLGLTGSYTMQASYSGIQLTSYSMVQDS
jgi:hypothetical protein